MAVKFACRTSIAAPVELVFDLSLSVEAHQGSMTRFGERAVAGVTAGQIGLGEEVTWQARHFGVPWRMTSRVIELERPVRFVDRQVRGPFARFCHEHRFEDEAGTTQMVDVVEFSAPLGVVGRIAELVVLGRYLQGLIQRRNGWLKEQAELRGSPGPAA